MTPSTRVPMKNTMIDPAIAKLGMEKIAQNLSLAILGKPLETKLAVTCLVARGHLLVEDVPGVGKTTLAEAISKTIGLSFSRIQFTADLLPADILGAQIFHALESTFEFRKGPLFHQLVLADELNRAPPRTQSALLEAMAQGQVSMDGVTHPLPEPFTVIGTQNPTDFSGTYPLPDSQLDRFLMRISLGTPSHEVEVELIQKRGDVDPVRTLPTVAAADTLLALQTFAAAVAVDSSVADYVVRIAHATREATEIERGVSTRAVLSLVSAAKAWALWDGRPFVTPGDVQSVLVPTWAHRILLKSSSQGTYSRQEAGHLLQELLRKVPVPQ